MPKLLILIEIHTNFVFIKFTKHQTQYRTKSITYKVVRGQQIENVTKLSFKFTVHIFRLKNLINRFIYPYLNKTRIFKRRFEEVSDEL